MDDRRIVDLYMNRDQTAISETERKYGHYCFTIANNILHQVNVFFDTVVNDTPYRMPAMATLTVERGTADDAWEILQTFGN